MYFGSLGNKRVRKGAASFVPGLFISGIIIVRDRQGGCFAMFKGVCFASGTECFPCRKEPGTKEKSHCGTWMIMIVYHKFAS